MYQHLKQLGLAAMSYESALGGLPLDAVTKNNSRPPYIPWVGGGVAAPGVQSGTQGAAGGGVRFGRDRIPIEVLAGMATEGGRMVTPSDYESGMKFARMWVAGLPARRAGG